MLRLNPVNRPLLLHFSIFRCKLLTQSVPFLYLALWRYRDFITDIDTRATTLWTYSYPIKLGRLSVRDPTVKANPVTIAHIDA